MDYDAILKNRQEVLDLVNAGKIQDAFLRIVDGAFIYSETDKECPHDVSVLQEKIIEGLIQHVTDENYRDIFIILNRIASFFGLSQRLCIEISLLNVTRKIDTDFQLQFLESLPAPIRQDPVIRLIEAETYRQAGNFIKALTIYNALPLRKSWWPFDGLWETLTRKLCCSLLEINSHFLKHQSLPPSGWNMEPHSLNALISGLIRPAGQDARSFRHEIEQIMWHTPVPNTDVGGLTISFLASHIKNLDADRGAIIFHLAVSFEKRNEIDTILQQEDYLVATLANHPLFIKYFDIFSQKHPSYRNKFLECLDIFLNSSFCREFQKGNMEAFKFSVLVNINVWATEVLSRYRKCLENSRIPGVPFLQQPRHAIFPEKGGENHLFIGVFGQMRDPRGSFSRIMQYLHNDTQHWRNEGKRVSIGISTWDQTGQKKIEDGSPASEFIHRLPAPLTRILSTFAIHTLADLRNRLPHTAEAIQQASYSNEQVSPELILDIAKENGFDPKDIFINISTENHYLDEIGREFRNFYKNAGSGVENQARMWHRIAALYDLARQATEASGMPIGTMALVRPDVLFEHSSLINLARETAALTLEGPAAVCDFDPQAYWIEGVGDRYFAGSACAVARAFDAKDLILQIIRDPILSTLYQDRPFWHRFAQTVFYESDTFLQSSTAIHMQFLRQNIQLEVLQDSLKKDYETITDTNLKDVIAQSISVS